jgi:hypothetical protein
MKGPEHADGDHEGDSFKGAEGYRELGDQQAEGYPSASSSQESRRAPGVERQTAEEVARDRVRQLTTGASRESREYQAQLREAQHADKPHLARQSVEKAEIQRSASVQRQTEGLMKQLGPRGLQRLRHPFRNTAIALTVVKRMITGEYKSPQPLTDEERRQRGPRSLFSDD